jgi:hypothetical protein
MKNKIKKIIQLAKDLESDVEFSKSFIESKYYVDPHTIGNKFRALMKEIKSLEDYGVCE